MATEHYRKTIGRQTRNALLKLLQNHPEGLNTGTLRNTLRVSMPVLSTHLKKLEQDKKIENFRDPKKDRRYRWYRIPVNRKEEVKAEVERIDVIRFIKDIPNPIYVYERSEKNPRLGVAIFAHAPLKGKQFEIWRSRIEKIAKQYAKRLDRSFGSKELMRGVKIATVIISSG